MSINKTELETAFREIMDKEFSHLPKESEIDYEFSENFNKKMKKLIENQRKPYWNLINSASKKVAIVCIIIITLFTTLFSVQAIREPIITFITEIYETFTKHIFVGDTSPSIKREYILGNLPKDFVQTNRIENDISVTTVFENNVGDIIEFSQSATEYAGITVDTENGEQYTINLNSTELSVYENEEVIHVVWIQDTYYFHITAYGNVDLNTLISIIASIK